MVANLCVIGGCGRPVRAWGWCRLHYRRWKTHGDPPMVTTPLRGSAHPGWKGDEIGYDAAHMRVKSVRGAARLHPCASGCGAMASAWAYTHDCPRERSDEILDARSGDVRAMKFSPDPERYKPLCHRCHTSTDRRLALGATELRS